MKRGMKKITALLLACLIAVGVTACSNPAPSNAGGTDPGSSSTTVKDTLNVGYNYDQNTTPWRNSSPSAISLANLYDTLYTYDDDMNVVPELAESCDISDDGLTYTIKIKEGVLFHNGEEMTAEDVAWSLNFSSAEGDSGYMLGTFESAEAVDTYTVEITLSAAFSPFLNCLSARCAYIADKSHFEAIGGTIDAYEADPIGSGPYQFVSREVGASTTLEAFEDYWDGPANIKNLCIKYITDANTQMISLESGEIDVMVTPPLSSLVLLNNDNLDWTWGNSASRVFFSLNVAPDRPTGDLNLRKAMQSLINREDILAAVNEGYGEIADICVPTGYTARPTDYHVVPEDLEKAQEYLDASSYNGEKLTLIVSSGTSNEKAANIFQAQCNQLGINVEVTPLDSATFNEVKNAGEFDLTAENAMSSMLDCDMLYGSIGPDAPISRYQYQDEINRLCEEGRVGKTVEERIASYTDLINLITDEVLEITCFYDVVPVAYNKALSGVKVHMLKMFNFHDWSWAA